ncbi:MAG: prolipoprotein diacylglyceryl transferase [Bacteroidales bacterium]|nr:prolipoprotein diacylglyceryl transferase [Bacteroidales bacterium]MCF8326956.1 prolipoprotein diacylglyceryl transferase [Bacteroidales bacterium]
MYPTLGHLFSDIFNSTIVIPIPTYGTMLALAFIAAYIILRNELQRKEKLNLIPVEYREEIVGKPATAQELIISGLFGFILGYKFLAIFFMAEQVAGSIKDFMFSLRGHWVSGIILAIVFAVLTYMDKEKKKLDKPKKQKVTVHAKEKAGTILLIAAISGIIGAKIFHQLENWQEFTADPLGSLFSSGGLTFFGGLIFGALAVIWYCHVKGIKIAYIMDIAAPAIVLAYAVGRVGCMTAGDGCWGIVNPDPKPEWLAWLPNWMWAFDYPHNVINEGVEISGCQGNYCHVLSKPVYPTPFYETTMNLIIFLGLWLSRKKINAHGVLFSIFLVFHGLARFLIEKIRVNTTYTFGDQQITQAEIIAVVLMILGVVGIFYFWQRYKKENIHEH